LVNPEVQALIRRLSLENPLWGAPRIHGELLKLGYEVADATVGASTWSNLLARQVIPFETAPRYLIRDADGIYGEQVRKTLAMLGIRRR
jgi:hypothetical protein